LHNFIVWAIFTLKSIKVGGNLTKLWQKQFLPFFETLSRFWFRHLLWCSSSHLSLLVFVSFYCSDSLISSVLL